MAKKKKQILKMQCSVCKQINYYVRKTRAVEEKLALKKFCKTCRTHTIHKEMKK